MNLLVNLDFFLGVLQNLNNRSPSLQYIYGCLMIVYKWFTLCSGAIVGFYIYRIMLGRDGKGSNLEPGNES